MYGKDYAYAATRLNGTIVRLKDGEPFHVANVDGDGIVSGIELRSGLAVRTTLDGLDVHPVKLGYVNHEGGGTSYIRRMPLRRDWKQGLREEQCITSNLRLGRINHQDLCNTIMGIFPKFSSAIKYNYSVAFHRHWAVNRKRLFYKGKQVGIIDKNNPVLDESHQYLKEYLQGCIT
jgi:hypothetical protein